MTISTWRCGTGALLALAAACFMVPPDLAATWWPLLTWLCAVVTLAAVAIHRPAGAGGWWLIASGLVVLNVGISLDRPGWRPVDGALRHIADVSYLSGYALFGIAVLVLVRRRAGGSDRDGALDSTVVTFTLAAVLWGIAFDPQALPADSTLLAKAVLVGFPLMAAWVTAMVVRLLSFEGFRHTSAWIMTLASVSALVGNVSWAFATQTAPTSTGQPPRWIIACWILSYVAMASAALHPSMRMVGEPQPRVGNSPPRNRLFILGGALAIGPLTVAWATGTPTMRVLLPTSAAVLVAGFVVWRLTRLFDDREAARQLMHEHALRQQELVRLSGRALAGLDVESLVQAAVRMVAVMLPAHRCEHVTSLDGRELAATETAIEIVDGDRVDGHLIAEPLRSLTDDDEVFLRGVTQVLASTMRRRADEDTIRRRSLEDDLTGLPNRVLLADRLTRALARLQRRPGGTVSVLFLDLDGFKDVNDSLGHAAGDRVLVTAAEALRGAIRPEDTLARWAGDEFVCLVEDVTGSHLEALALRCRDAVGRALPLDEIDVGVSIGIVTTAEPAASVSTLIRDADAAMYKAKEAGGNGIFVFDDALRAGISRRKRLVRDLPIAVARGELHLVYQPLVLLDRSGAADPVDTVVGAEALIRWEHTELGPVSPNEFIPLAESNGTIRELGSWILQTACAQLARWSDELSPESPFTVFVNLSPVQLADARVVDHLDAVIAGTGIDPRRLGFELTETAVLEGGDDTIAVLDALRGRGCRIALDDFGTGYSSLTHLRDIPLDLLKVDASFVNGMHERARDRAIVAAVVSVAGELGLQVVAEGVETDEQLAGIRALGCPLAQGYHLGRPGPAAQIDDLLAIPVRT